MQGKPVTLRQYKGCSFIAVSSPNWTGVTPKDQSQNYQSSPLYALTDSGILCLLDSGLSITDSVELKVKKCFGLSISKKLAACACNNGVVKLFAVNSLEYSGSLCYHEGSKYMQGKAGISQSDFQHLPTLPDSVACQFSSLSKLVVIYDDHSLYIWDIQDLHEATRCCVLVSHRACIWDIKNLVCENMHGPSIACVVKGCSGGVSFTTCSADGTIRLWDCVSQPASSPEDSLLDSNNKSMTNVSRGTTNLVSAGIFERDSVASDISSPGFRSMAVSSDGKYLAAGDYQGNLHIFNLYTSEYRCIQNAHCGEILSLSFSLANKKNFVSDMVSASNNFLASGGQDRMIHLYDAGRDFELIGTQNDHSDAVTTIKMTGNGLKLLSSGADRSLVFRNVAVTNAEHKITCCHQIACRGTVHDMVVDPSSEIVVTVGQDKKINKFCITSGKLIRSFKQDDLGDPIKVTVDPSCSYLVCSYSSRYICLYDYMTGEMVAEASGHSDIITGVIFLPDCRHLVSVDGDGCIFVWKLPGHLSSRMLRKILLQDSSSLSSESRGCNLIKSRISFDQVGDPRRFCSKAVAGKGNPNQISQSLPLQNKSSQGASEFKFSISRLPKWAQSKVGYTDPIPADHNYTSSKNAGTKNISSAVDWVLECSSHDSQNPSTGGNKKSGLCMSPASSDTDSSPGLTTPERNFSSALDNRWLTIHTVFFDHLNSPEVWQMDDLNLPVLSPENLSEDNVVGGTSKHKRIKLSPLVHNFEPSKPAEAQNNALNKRDRLDDSGTSCNNGIPFSNSSLCHHNITNKMAALFSAPNENFVEAITDNDSLEKISQDNDSSLSANLKAMGRKSRARKCYSAEVRKNHLRGWKPFCGKPLNNFQGENQNTATKMSQHGLLEGAPPMELLEVSSRENVCEQEVERVTANSPSNNFADADTDAAGRSINMEVIKLRNPEVDFHQLRKQETIIMCKEALSNLEAAAESAFHLFSKVGTLDPREENLSADEAQFYMEAAESLSRIQNKVDAVARFALSPNHDS